MNKRQKIVQEAFLDNEEAVIRRLKQVYNQSLKDITAKTRVLQDQINTLDALEGMTSDPGELAKLQSMKQAKVYQKQYQDALKKQVNSILDNMQVEEFKTVAEYLNKCYEEGFLGTMYDLHGQGIPLCFPMDQEAMVRAVQLDSKISNGLYSRLGEDVALLKKKITAQVSRGISTGMSFQQVAKQLSDYTNIGFNNAVRITRTEGHRIQVQSGMDACYKAKDKGADVVKQWDSTLDKRTRKSHQKVDGEIKELDEPFSNGLMFPGDPSGGASEVVNCRCALLQRARWALDEDELQTLKDRAKYFDIDKNDSFEDFKKKYLKAAESPVVQEKAKSKFVPAKTIEEAEEFAQQFVSDYKSKYSGNVSYKGIDVETANKINSVLEDVFEKYDVQKLRNISPMNFRKKEWQGSTADAAYQWGSGGTLFFNQKFYKNAKTLKAHVDQAEELLDTVLNGADKFLERKNLNPIQRRYVEAIKNSGCANITLRKDFPGDYTEATFVHEMGHMLDDKIFKLQTTSRSIDTRKSMEKYAGNISGYAATNTAEYVAESFTAWWYGYTDIVDPELVKIFEGGRK